MGRFNYNTGESVQFSIGDIILPQITADNIVHITKIFNATINDQRLINLVRLLLTQDEDLNTDSGYLIYTRKEQS